LPLVIVVSSIFEIHGGFSFSDFQTKQGF
jgi:hypothetical protein